MLTVAMPETADGLVGAPEVRSLALETAVRRVGRVIQGKDDVVRLALAAFLARGHLLVEDVPGVGKTTLARALARVVGGSFHRIQLTADLLPADLTGGMVLDRETQALAFRPGPLFANVVLADELNRATPRTQSGLLESMSERSVSVDGATRLLPQPFFVIATQNPVEHHGVYVLPQSQMDRFLVRTELGYPDDETEVGLMTGERAVETVEDIQPAFTPDELAAFFAAVDRVVLSRDVAAYLQAIVQATRRARDLATGVSTRGALAFARVARARALVEGRTYVTPDDVLRLVGPVCAHRVIPVDSDRVSRVEREGRMRELAASIPVPL